MSMNLIVEEDVILVVDTNFSGADAEAAAASALQAEASAASASTSQAAASASATDSATSASASANSATASAGSAADSAASAAAAHTSEDNAADSATGAASAAAQLTAALLSFNKLWLGPHDADPTTDNNGDPLAEGAMYENTSTTPAQIRIYHDGEWQDYNADAEQATANAQAAAVAAANSAGAASASATASAASATAAGTSETNAAASEAAAAASETHVEAITAAFNGEKTLDVSGGDIVLNAADSLNAIFIITGALTGGVTRKVTLQNVPHNFVVRNTTTGSGNVSIYASGQVPFANVLQGSSASLFSDATGVYATSATPGMGFSGYYVAAVNTTLSLTHIGALFTQTGAGRLTTLPLASTYPAGLGVTIAAAAASSIISQGGDTCADIALPYSARIGDRMFFVSDGVSAWKLAWYSNKAAPQFDTNVSTPVLLAGGATDNTVDAIQAQGSVGATGAGGILRAVGATVSAAAQVISTALGLDLLAAGANPLRLFTNALERVRITAAGLLLVGATDDDGSGALLQVAGQIKSTEGGIVFPDDTVQTTSNGVTAPASTYYTLGATDTVGSFAEGDTSLRTNGFNAPHVEVKRKGLWATRGVHYTLNADAVHIDWIDGSFTADDEFEVLTKVIYSPSTVYVPSQQPIAVSEGDTFIPFAHVRGFAYLFNGGIKLEASSYTEDETGFFLTGWAASASSSFEVLNITPIQFGNVMAKSANLSDVQDVGAAQSNLKQGLTLLGFVEAKVAVTTLELPSVFSADYESYDIDLSGLTTDYTGSSSGSGCQLTMQTTANNGATWITSATHNNQQLFWNLGDTAISLSSGNNEGAMRLGAIGRSISAAWTSAYSLQMHGVGSAGGLQNWTGTLSAVAAATLSTQQALNSGNLSDGAAKTGIRLVAVPLANCTGITGRMAVYGRRIK